MSANALSKLSAGRIPFTYPSKVEYDVTETSTVLRKVTSVAHPPVVHHYIGPAGEETLNQITYRRNGKHVVDIYNGVGALSERHERDDWAREFDRYYFEGPMGAEKKVSGIMAAGHVVKFAGPAGEEFLTERNYEGTNEYRHACRRSQQLVSNNHSVVKNEFFRQDPNNPLFSLLFLREFKDGSRDYHSPCLSTTTHGENEFELRPELKILKANAEARDRHFRGEAPPWLDAADEALLNSSMRWMSVSATGVVTKYTEILPDDQDESPNTYSLRDRWLKMANGAFALSAFEYLYKQALNPFNEKSGMLGHKREYRTAFGIEDEEEDQDGYDGLPETYDNEAELAERNRLGLTPRA